MAKVKLLVVIFGNLKMKCYNKYIKLKGVIKHEGIN